MVIPRRKTTVRTHVDNPYALPLETFPLFCEVVASVGTRILHRQPYALAGRRHVETLDPERRERIDDRVDDRGQCADRAGLARALGAQWITLGRHWVRGDLHIRDRVGAGHAVIHEAAGQVLPRSAVVDDLLP